MESDSHSIHLYELNWNKTCHHRCHGWSFGAMKIRSALLKATVQTSGTGELSQTTQDVTSEHSNCLWAARATEEDGRNNGNRGPTSWGNMLPQFIGQTSRDLSTYFVQLIHQLVFMPFLPCIVHAVLKTVLRIVIITILSTLQSRHSVGTHRGNELTRNSPGNARPQWSHFAEPLWTFWSKECN